MHEVIQRKSGRRYGAHRNRRRRSERRRKTPSGGVGGVKRLPAPWHLLGTGAPVPQETQSSISRVALYQRAQHWRPPKCPSATERVNTRLCSHTRKHHASPNGTKMPIQATTRVSLPDGKLIERRKTPKNGTVGFSLQKVQKSLTQREISQAGKDKNA